MSYLKETHYYKAIVKKDPSFDGLFFFGVHTTGIFCRCVCPSRTPQLKNISIFKTTLEAQTAGFRACKRCRPESIPHSAAWKGTKALVLRALKLIEKSVQNGEQSPNIPSLAIRLGVGERHFRRLFVTHLKLPPRRFILKKRLEKSQTLLIQNKLSVSEIAFESGFRSLRRFNDAFKKHFHHSPTHFLKAQK